MSVNLNELDSILEKVSDLKVFFDFGQKTVPALEDVSAFIREIGPAVESLRAMIEVTSVRIPKASEQLARVNQTSEQASTDILNTIDKMVALLEGLMNQGYGAGSSDTVSKTAESVSKSITALVEKSGWDEDIRQLYNVWDLHEQSLKSMNPASGIKAQLQTLQEDCTNIMMALQVQDITGQQISMVIGTLQAIGDVIDNLAEHFSEVAAVRHELAELNRADGTEKVGAEDTKRLVESLLMKARSGEVLKQ